MTDKLKEEFHKEFDFYYEAGDDTREEEIYWWLSKIKDHNEALLKRVEEMRKTTDMFDKFIEMRIEEINQGGIAKADHNLGYNKALEDIKLLITNK